MDFRFTPEQEAFRKEVSDFLDKEAPAEWRKRRVHVFEASGQENWIETYRAMAAKLGAKGWLSLNWPREYGGQDASPFYPLILFEELIKHHSPGYESFGLGIVAPALLLKGSEEPLQHGIIIIATGAEELKPEGLFLYGKDDRVVTQLDFEDELVSGKAPGSVVMIQCVGS